MAEGPDIDRDELVAYTLEQLEHMATPRVEEV
jgi:hypothetical protein